MVQIRSHEKEKRDLFLKKEMENGQGAMIKKKGSYQPDEKSTKIKWLLENRKIALSSYVQTNTIIEEKHIEEMTMIFH